MRYLLCAAAAGLMLLGFAAGDGTAPAGGKEPPPKIVKTSHELRSLAYADTYVLLRFERSSGRAWTYTMNKWQEINETTRVPTGNYEVHLVPVANSVSPREYRAFRIERETGTTWTLILNKWEEITD